MVFLYFIFQDSIWSLEFCLVFRLYFWEFILYAVAYLKLSICIISIYIMSSLFRENGEYWVLNLFIICFLLQDDCNARLIKWGESEVSRYLFMVPEYKDIWGNTRDTCIFHVFPRPSYATERIRPVEYNRAHG